MLSTQIRRSAGLAASLAAFAFAAPYVALADDFSFGGFGASFVPLKETRVRMVSEDIVAKFEGGAWQLDTKYVFENPTDKEIRLRMGFPESRCSGDGDCNVEVPFRDMTTWVRGERVPLRRGGAWLGEKYPSLGKVWMYEATFGARERVEIRHKYHVNGNDIIGGERELGYVVETGALWAGPIEWARFRYLMPPRIRSIVMPKVGAPSPAHWAVVEGRVWTEVSVEFKDWTPTDNLWIGFNETLTSDDWRSRHEGGDAVQPVASCPLGWNQLLSEVSTNQGDIEQLAQAQQVLVEKWAALGVDKIRACRQWLVAAYGARFRRDVLNKFFYGPEGFVDHGPPYLAYSPNKNFSVDSMEPEDQILYEVFQRTEAMASHVEPSAEEVFDVETAPKAVTGEVGDLVRFGVLPSYAGVDACQLSVYGLARFANPVGVFGNASKTWEKGDAAIELEAVVAPAGFDSWFGDKAWLWLGMAKYSHGTDVDGGGSSHHTRLALPVRPASHTVIARPSVKTKFLEGVELAKVSAQRDAQLTIVTFWNGAYDTSRSATAKVNAVVVRSGAREILYAEVLSDLGDAHGETGGLAVTLSYPTTPNVPTDVVITSRALRSERGANQPFELDRFHIDAAK